jgi:hypothetical protein
MGDHITSPGFSVLSHSVGLHTSRGGSGTRKCSLPTGSLSSRVDHQAQPPMVPFLSALEAPGTEMEGARPAALLDQGVAQGHTRGLLTQGLHGLLLLLQFPFQGRHLLL